MKARLGHVDLLSRSAVSGMLTKNINKPLPAPSAGNKGARNNNSSTSMESRSDLFGERLRTYTKTKVPKLLLPLSMTLDNSAFDHFKKKIKVQLVSVTTTYEPLNQAKSS